MGHCKPPARRICLVALAAKQDDGLSIFKARLHNGVIDEVVQLARNAKPLANRYGVDRELAVPMVLDCPLSGLCGIVELRDVCHWSVPFLTQSCQPSTTMAMATVSSSQYLSRAVRHALRVLSEMCSNWRRA